MTAGAITSTLVMQLSCYQKHSAGFQVAVRYLVAGLFSALCFGCTTPPLLPSKIIALRAVSFPEPRVAKSAFHQADGSLSPDFGSGLPKLMPGGGAAPGLVGGLIDAVVMGVQRNKFRDHYQKSWTTVHHALPKDISARLKPHGNNALKQHPVFRQVYANSSAAYFDSEILSFGLNRFSTEGEDTLLKIGIRVSIKLVDHDGTILFSGIVSARSADYYTLHQLAEDSELIERLYIQAGDSFEREFYMFLDLITGN